MVAWCISDISHPRNVLPVPKWLAAYLQSFGSSVSGARCIGVGFLRCGRWRWMGEALHRVLGSLYHIGVVELLMVTVCLPNNAISSLCTNACSPEMPLTMAMFQWKHISPQPHLFGFYSSITSTLCFCRTMWTPKNYLQMTFLVRLFHDRIIET